MTDDLGQKTAGEGEAPHAGGEARTAAGDGARGNLSRTFTQAELDAIIADRLAREREKYRDYENLRKAADELQKLKQAQMTEAERLQAAAAENERRAIQAEGKAAVAEVRADFVEKAISAGVTDVRLAYLAAQADGLLGSYDPEKGVGQHNLEELRKRYPHLFRQPVGGRADGAVGTAGRNSFDMNDFIRRAAGRA